ncbi:type IV secretion protein Rhs [Candidatus Pantoea multigeneris]|uniref:type IV secretion protein Rhs n=1 Tax=Candidatus Pantoea multigeneris TaxID=2608357 RepID=UPI001964A4D7|nr:type IV secretion protein Rhs [Pantoea multigeneris]
MTETQEKNKETKEGSLRLMTLGEIALARRVFGGSIVYHRVWIHCASYLPFGLQGENVAMAPNGEIWFRKNLYRKDFSDICTRLDEKHTFIHEMAHVWQFQHHQWVRMRGMFSWMADYTYDLIEGKRLTDYSLEQQAQIIADHYILNYHGCDSFDLLKINKNVSYIGKASGGRLLEMYRKTLSGFL